jgi:hypothetical protein
MTLQPNEYDTISPVFHYVDEIEDPDIIDFEAGIPFDPYGTSDTELILVSDPELVFEGDFSAVGILEAGQDQLIVKTIENWQWEEGNTVFLEMNYSSNNTFSVGLIVHSGVTVNRVFALVINPSHIEVGSPVWKKIYVDLGYVVLNNPDADFYELYFETIKDSDNSVAELYLDNLKVVAYQD